MKSKKKKIIKKGLKMETWGIKNRQEHLKKLIYTLNKISNYSINSVLDKKDNNYKKKDVPEETQKKLLIDAQKKRLRKLTKKESN